MENQTATDPAAEPHRDQGGSHPTGSADRMYIGSGQGASAPAMKTVATGPPCPRRHAPECITMPGIEVGKHLGSPTHSAATHTTNKQHEHNEQQQRTSSRGGTHTPAP